MNQTAINNMYDTYNENYPQKEEDFKTTELVLNEIDKIFDASKTVAKFFSYAVHLYPLFIVIRIYLAKKLAVDSTSIAKKLDTFLSVYQQNPDEGIVSEYRLAATEGTQKRANREMRINRLTDWLALP
jgi:hypothetical protein